MLDFMCSIPFMHQKHFIVSLQQVAHNTTDLYAMGVLLIHRDCKFPKCCMMSPELQEHPNYKSVSGKALRAEVRMRDL